MTAITTDLHTAMPAILLGGTSEPGGQAAQLEASSRRAWPWRAISAIASAWEWLFGTVSLIGGLALLATIPILQLLSLGYLLEVSGRVARTGRLRSGFIGVRKAARVGSIVLGVWLFF